jgi:hypothetical protein
MKHSTTATMAMLALCAAAAVPSIAEGMARPERHARPAPRDLQAERKAAAEAKRLRRQAKRLRDAGPNAAVTGRCTGENG